MGKKILILNWRDPKSPLEGGAERFTKKYAEYWASEGHEVYWVTNSFPNSVKEEQDNGVTYIRLGPSLTGTLSNYFCCYIPYLVKSILFIKQFIKTHNIDLVIDEIHGFPFFTPLYSKTRNVLLVCEVAGAIWDKMFPFPINVVGKLVEKWIYKLYRNSEIWAISDHTKENILEYQKDATVRVIDLGIDPLSSPLITFSKDPFPSAVFLARLVKMKGIESALAATALIANKHPDFKLYVIGSGDKEYLKTIQALISSLHIKKNVVMLGRVSEEEKISVLQKAHFLIHPSYKEGFGLTVLEAGLVGTPSIVRSKSSLDGLVKHGYNGFRFDTDEEIAQYFLQSYSKQEYEGMCNNAKIHAKTYIWPEVLKRSNQVTQV